MALADGMTLKFADLPTRNLNVRAETSPSVVGSVRFGLDGQANYRTETSSPYALPGDSGGNSTHGHRRSGLTRSPPLPTPVRVAAGRPEHR
jgi:hypothetical protein